MKRGLGLALMAMLSGSLSAEDQSERLIQAVANLASMQGQKVTMCITTVREQEARRRIMFIPVRVAEIAYSLRYCVMHSQFQSQSTEALALMYKSFKDGTKESPRDYLLFNELLFRVRFRPNSPRTMRKDVVALLGEPVLVRKTGKLQEENYGVRSIFYDAQGELMPDYEISTCW